jgi:hypothetical protein
LTGRGFPYQFMGRALSNEVPFMRRIEIVEEPNQIPYKWIAIDQVTRQPLLRMSDLHQLRDVCFRLVESRCEAAATRGAAPSA